MAAKKGSLSISSENIFPIIKKWVYSDHDIFARELVSNGCDAITKLKKLDMMGEYTLPDDYKGKIQVIVNPEEKTLKFIDNGLGMTADEVEEYITQIAFSGATEFLNKYKDKTTEDDMIGHFGLGFYSAFMVADEVHIDTLSYKEGAKPVHWVSEGGTEYEMEEGDKEEVGSEITLFLNEDCVEFLYPKQMQNRNMRRSRRMKSWIPIRLLNISMKTPRWKKKKMRTVKKKWLKFHRHPTKQRS